MFESLKGYYLQHPELSIHFESFNDECAIVKEAHRRIFAKPGIKTNAG